MMSLAQYRSFFAHSIVLAAIAFGLVHGIQVFITLIIKYKSAGSLSGYFVQIFVEITQILFFLLVAFPAGLLSSFAALPLVNLFNMRKLSSYVAFGAIVGLIFLPLCASILFFLFHAPDWPSYLDRCAEFFLPMLAAGIVGGYVFGRIACASQKFQ